MALNSGKILMRRGQEANFDTNKMMPGEWAVSLDSKFVRMCFSPGVCIRMATYEAFEADMEQIRAILAECQTVEEAVQRIYEDIKDVAVDVERIEAAAASALKSEKNALNSANSASQSANTATQKASEAVGSANIASTKAAQATEGASTATQKASEAANSADNVRNMSNISQSYAVGGTGTREGEDTDNAKYYNQQASDSADRAEAAADRASSVADVGVATTEKAGLVKPDGETIRVDPNGTIHADRGTTSYTELENKPKINDVVLEGEKTLDELGIASKEALEETDNKVNIIIENAELRFKETASGENIHLGDSADSKLVEFALYGKAVQDGTPTPQNPIDIVVAGESYNLIPYPYEITTMTVNGITWTDLGDGRIMANGTATETSSFDKFLGNQTEGLREKLQSYGEVILTGCPSGGGSSTYRLFVWGAYNDGAYSANDYGSGATFTFDNDDKGFGFSAQVIKGVTVKNLVFKPMLRKASVKNDRYMPYGKGSVEVKSENEDGTKSITATIPTGSSLAGIPVDLGGNYTDQSGQQWICDEVVKYVDGSGTYIQRIEKAVFDGVNNKVSVLGSSQTHGTSFGSQNSYNTLNDKLVSINGNTLDIKSDYFTTKVVYYGNTANQGNGMYRTKNTIWFSISKEMLETIGITNTTPTVNDMNAWMQENPVTVYGILAEPIGTPLTAEQLAEIEKLSTFYPTTSISNDFDCGMKVKYIVDSKNYIDNQLAIQAKLQEEALLNMMLLMPEEVQASMIENDTNKLLSESEV